MKKLLLLLSISVNLSCFAQESEYIFFENSGKNKALFDYSDPYSLVSLIKNNVENNFWDFLKTDNMPYSERTSFAYPFFELKEKYYQGDRIAMYPDGQHFNLLRPNDASVTADEYLQGLLDTGAADYGFVGDDFLNDVENYTTQPKQLEKFRRWFDEASPGDYILQDPKEKWITSSSITAYNLKEDWYFDKERSILDRRIIAIAPVTRYKAKEWNENIKENRRFNRYSNMIFENERLTPDGVETGVLIDAEYKPYPDPVVEAEMFWLYFPELRNVLINYYVYNDQNDAQWMTFDDLFWKRRFTSKIFRVSDKFDREIQDYKFGVDALYEAERLKEEIRNWEINVWNY